jgi:hypothetical protein
VHSGLSGPPYDSQFGDLLSSTLQYVGGTSFEGGVVISFAVCTNFDFILAILFAGV